MVWDIKLLYRYEIDHSKEIESQFIVDRYVGSMQASRPCFFHTAFFAG